MFIHDIVKIRFIRQGYLPNHPPHLISDEEMCDAFLPCNFEDASWDTAEYNYFRDTYPLSAGAKADAALSSAYAALVSAVMYHVNCLKSSESSEYKLPDWVYAYMLGAVVGPTSDVADRHDLFILLNTDNLADDFNINCYRACYEESTQWVKKLPADMQQHRPPSIFGEPHVIKALRLRAVELIN